MPGPKPNPRAPHSRHRSARSAFLVLPESCDLDPPDLPTGREWSDAEQELWREIWSGPQATMFDDTFSTVVAMYVIHYGKVLAGTAVAWQAQEARHLADRLGLSPAGLNSLRWRLLEPGETPSAVVPLRSVP